VNWWLFSYICFTWKSVNTILLESDSQMCAYLCKIYFLCKPNASRVYFPFHIVMSLSYCSASCLSSCSISLKLSFLCQSHFMQMLFGPECDIEVNSLKVKRLIRGLGWVSLCILYMLCRLMYWRMLLIYAKQLPVSGLWVHRRWCKL